MSVLRRTGPICGGRQRCYQTRSRPMPSFTLHDLEKRVRERAKASADASYTRQLLDKGVAHCARKLGEEAIETVLAAIGEDRDRLIGRPQTSSTICWSCSRHAGSGSRKWKPGSPSARGSRACRKRHRASARATSRPCPATCARLRRDPDKPGAQQGLSMEQRHGRWPFTLPRLLAGGMGRAARGHADDADPGGGDPGALAA